jgi:hypothetical protein
MSLAGTTMFSLPKYSYERNVSAALEQVIAIDLG